MNDSRNNQEIYNHTEQLLSRLEVLTDDINHQTTNSSMVNQPKSKPSIITRKATILTEQQVDLGSSDINILGYSNNNQNLNNTSSQQSIDYIQPQYTPKTYIEPLQQHQHNNSPPSQQQHQEEYQSTPQYYQQQQPPQQLQYNTPTAPAPIQQATYQSPPLPQQQQEEQRYTHKPASYQAPTQPQYNNHQINNHTPAYAEVHNNNSELEYLQQKLQANKKSTNSQNSHILSCITYFAPNFGLMTLFLPMDNKIIHSLIIVITMFITLSMSYIAYKLNQLVQKK